MPSWSDLRRRAGSPAGRSTFAIAAIFVASLILLTWYTRHGTMWHSLWAEDGRIFTQCQTQNGWTCVRTPYAGYLQLAPRLLVILVPLAPVNHWALAAAVLALLGDAVALTTVYWSARWLMPSAALRAVVVLTFAASAGARWESAGNLADLHWFLLASGIMIGLDVNSRDGRRPTAVRTTWLVVACLSEALALIIAVSCVVGLLLRRQRRGTWSRVDLVGTGLVVTSAIAQTVVHAFAGRVRPTAPPIHDIPSAVAHGYQRWVLRWGWNGAVGSGTTFETAFLVVVAAFLVAGVAIAAARRAQGRPTGVRLTPILIGLAFLGTSVAVFAVSMIVNHGIAARYATVPFLLLLLGVATILSALFAEVRLAAPAMTLAATAAAIAVLVIGPVKPLVSGGPVGWRHAVTLGRQECASTGKPKVVVRIAPRQWGMLVDCSSLR